MHGALHLMLLDLFATIGILVHPTITPLLPFQVVAVPGWSTQSVSVHHATAGSKACATCCQYSRVSRCCSLATSCFHPPLSSLQAEPPQRIAGQPRVVGMLSCPACVVVLHVAADPRVHLRVIVWRRMCGVCEEEHGGQDIHSWARPARLTMPHHGTQTQCDRPCLPRSRPGSGTPPSERKGRPTPTPPALLLREEDADFPHWEASPKSTSPTRHGSALRCPSRQGFRHQGPSTPPQRPSWPPAAVRTPSGAACGTPTAPHQAWGANFSAPSTSTGQLQYATQGDRMSLEFHTLMEQANQGERISVEHHQIPGARA